MCQQWPVFSLQPLVITREPLSTAFPSQPNTPASAQSSRPARLHNVDSDWADMCVSFMTQTTSHSWSPFTLTADKKQWKTWHCQISSGRNQENMFKCWHGTDTNDCQKDGCHISKVFGRSNQLTKYVTLHLALQLVRLCTEMTDNLYYIAAHRTYPNHNFKL